MKRQIQACAVKAEKATMKLQGIMPRVGGPKTSSRRILSAVAHSIMLYACPIWGQELSVKTNLKVMEKVQRRVALRVCCGFRTVSTEAALVLAGIPPIDLMVRERSAWYRGTTDEAGNDCMEGWQDRWEKLTDRAAWTKILIPNVTIWNRRTHGEVDFYLTQALSGHGFFGQYRERFKISEVDLCELCQEVDSAEHVLFHCQKFQWQRKKLTERVGAITPHNMVGKMMEREDVWMNIQEFIKILIKLKEDQFRK